ncbi:uncharacterized protein BDV14DRAFT_202283 [Aspergillus stella-maris]|uniref:uncharacterized protein n=1 Tax=Aspergillus stella-maris TaxID=1810926 RepID=UPI003CCE25B5
MNCLLPPSSFDTHVHVFDPSITPYAPDRAYTPDDAPLSNLLTFNANLSHQDPKSTLVLVQPSPYKTDNTVLLRCLAELHRQGRRAYGIAVIDIHSITDAELAVMHRLGVRGIRLNFQADGRDVDVARLGMVLHQAAERIRDLPGWMIQLFVPEWVWDELFESILTLPVPIIADHMGGMLGSSKLPPTLKDRPQSQSGFNSLIRLAKLRKVIIKISGLYRASTQTETCYDDTRPIIQTFAKEIPEMCIWGSDWPHTGEGKKRAQNKDLSVKEPFRVVDNVAILENLRGWVGENVWVKIMRENPKRIFEDL